MTIRISIPGFALALSLVVVAAGVLISAVRSSTSQKRVALFPIVVKGKYGYINQTGEVVITPRFDKAKRFSEGLARVRVGSKWGFIDETGKIIIQPQFELEHNDLDNDYSLDFHEGMAAVSLNQGQKWGFIDRSGKMSIAAKYSAVGRFSGGIATAYDFERPRTLQPDFLPAHARTSSSWYIDRTGKTLNFPIVGQTFSDGMAVVSVGPRPNTKYGYIDRTGQLRVPARFEIARSFHDGLAKVRTTNANDWGYIDKTGKFAIQPHLFDSEPGNFNEGLAAIESGEWGFINKKGTRVIEPRFVIVGRFSEGLAGACSMEAGDRQICGFIDPTGKWAISDLPLLGASSDFYQGLALVWTEDFYGYIDKKGKYVWRTAETIDPRHLVGECTIWSFWRSGDYDQDDCRQ